MAHAVANMVEILEQDQYHLDLFPDCKYQIQDFLEKARSWRDILLQSRRWDTTPVRAKEGDERALFRARLIHAAHKTEDVIETYIRNRILLIPPNQEFELDLTPLVQEFESIMECLDGTVLNSSTRMRARSIFTILLYVSCILILPIIIYVLNFPFFALLFFVLNWPILTISFYVLKLLYLTILLNVLIYVINCILNFLVKFHKLDYKVMRSLNQEYEEWWEEPWFPVDHLNFSVVVPWYQKLDPCTKKDVPAIFEDEFQTLKARLIGGPSKLQIIYVDGMYGMGKRTLARRLYNDPLIATHFRMRAWVTSPTEDDEKNCLLNLLKGLGILTNGMHQKNVDELKVYIKNTLQNIRYFIVIHDVLDKGNMLTFTRIFRNYGVRARILFTTVGMDVAVVATYGELYKMRILTDCESLLLLRHKVFGRDHCPIKLEPIEKNIMQLCKGSPSVVSLVAGVLATSDKKRAAWELVATTLDRELKHLDIVDIHRKLVSLIYFHLPHYLRPCIVYASVFHEFCDIKASKMIKLWISEGFVRQSAGESLEDVAETYLRILIDKNLLYLTHEESNGRVKAFQVPIVLRNIFWQMGNVERLLGSKGWHEHVDRDAEKLARRVSARGLCHTAADMELPSLARSFLSVSGASRQQVSIYLKLTLLRVLEILQLEFYQFPMEILQQVLLRYLAFSCYANLRNSFSVFRNLQTLTIRRLPGFRAFSLPSDFWGLTQVRHVKCKENFILCHPSNGEEVVHRNLQTLSNMQLFGVTNQFLTQIPNIRNLGIFCNIAMETVFDLSCLIGLETLKCSSDWSLASRKFLAFLTLPISLRKLNLCLCRIPSEFMKIVGSLPNLEHLKLQKSDFIDADLVRREPKWETAEGQFPLLLSLEMLDLDLINWKASPTCFPKLKHLVVRNCYAMVEIPSGIGHIQSLELIEVNTASPSVLVSAMQIKKEQEGRGNKLLQLRTHRVV